MNIKQDHKKRVKEIVGKQLLKVYYLQIDLSDDQPYWNQFSDDFDYLDYGLVFVFENDEHYEIRWDSEFYQYGLSIKNHSKYETINNIKIFDVSDKENWKSILNKRIIDVKIFWDCANEGSKTFEYPQDFEILFDDGSKIYFSASFYNKKDDEFIGFSDEVVVFFDDKVADKYKIGSYKYF